MKPTKKEATPAPATKADESPAPAPVAVASDEPAPPTDATPGEESAPVAEDDGATASQSPEPGGETEGASGGEAPPEAAADENPADPDPDAATSDAWTDTVFGKVACRARIMSVREVLDCLPQGRLEKIDVLKSEPSTRSLANRMLGTDGRCTPIVLSGEDTPDNLVDGSQTIAAALVAGVEKIPVVLVRPSDVGRVQSFIGSRPQRSTTSSDDDDLVWRINGLNAS